MIFPDKIVLKIAGVERTVQGLVTFLDSSKLLNFAGGTQLVSSRLRIYLSPYGDAIPASGVSLAWKQFTNLTVEGLVEPHYIRGRLHHYECVARSL